jgi:O-antigen ligase
LLYIVASGIFAAPLPIGLVTAAGWSSGILAVGLCLFAWSTAVVAKRADVTVSPGCVRGPAILYAAAVIWAGLQLLAIEGLVHPLWPSAAEVLATPVTAAVTLVPHDTAEGVARLAAYAAVFWLALQAGRRGDRAERLTGAAAIMIGLYTLYGLAVSLPGMSWLAVYERTVGGRFSGPFVNANVFATFAGIGIITATAVLYEGFRAAARGIETPKERRRLKIEYVAQRGWPYVGTWILCVSGLLLSQSRGGFLSMVIALTAFFLLLAWSQHRHRTNAWTAAALSTAAMVVFVALSGGQLFDRLGPETLGAQSIGRAEVYSVTMTAIRDAPFEGFGLGSFREVFRMYQPADLPGLWTMAHNTYLENALELGVPAAASLTLAVAWLGLRCLVGALRRRSRRALPAAGFAVCVLTGLHSAVDFPLQIPAITALFAFVLGLCVAQSWGRDEDTSLTDRAWQPRRDNR